MTDALMPVGVGEADEDEHPLRVALALAQAEAGPDGLLVVSPEGRMLFTNRRFAEIWGFSHEILVQKDDNLALEAALERVADPEAFMARVKELYATRRPSHEEVVLRDGRTLDRYAAPLHGDDGTYLGMAWYFRDVTAQKRVEEELRALATTLQASLLPPRAPSIPGMEVATSYRPGDRAVEVGGDFFDVFRLGSNDWGIAMGDVCGKGAPAAALTALTRYTLRAAAVHNFDPADVLRELNVAVLAEPAADGRFCSVAFARLELDRCGAWITLACGGHPLPVVVRRAGWVDVRGMAGTLIGLFDEIDLAVDLVGLGPGDALVFCTDGITEARNEAGELFGEEALFSVLLQHAGADAETLVSRIVAESQAYCGGRARDDAAILVVRVPDDATDDPVARLHAATGLSADELVLPGYPVGDGAADRHGCRSRPPREARIRLAAEAQSAGAARRFVVNVLRSWRMGEVAEDGDLVLLTSELCTNAVLHAHSAITVVVRYDGRVVRVEVGDGSRVLPTLRRPDSEDTGGRGVLLVDRMAAAWGVSETVSGKRVWFEVSAPPSA